MPKYELQKIAFTDPTDLTTQVVTSTILEGSDGATRAFVEDSAEGFVTEDNQTIEDDITYAFTALGVKTDDTDQAQLYTWANNGTKLTVSGYAYDKFFQMDNVYIRPRVKGQDRLTWMFNAQKSGDVGYNDDGKLDTETMLSGNGLNMYYWQEGSMANVPAGWEKDGGSTTWSSGTVEFSTTGGSSVKLYRNIYFPFEGSEITFFVDVTALTDSLDPKLQIVGYNSSGSGFIAGTTQPTGTGILSRALTIPSGTVYVRCQISVNTNDSITFQNPGLSIGTSTEYISQ